MTYRTDHSARESNSFRLGFAVFLIAAAALYGLAAAPAHASPVHASRPAPRHNVPWVDQRVRQALRMQIDRRAIEDHVTSGDADQMAHEAFVTMLTGNVFQNELEELAELVGEFDELGATFVDTPYGFEAFGFGEFPEPTEDRRFRVTLGSELFGQPRYFDLETAR